MKKFIIAAIGLFAVFAVLNIRAPISGAPPYGDTKDSVPPNLYDYLPFSDWKRPEGPPRVGLQVGHWKNNLLPEELERLRGNTGSSGGGKSEWEVNYTIAKLVEAELEARGVVVDILPATVPPSYWADVFLAIHADGSLDKDKRGYKAAGPWRDLTGNSQLLVDSLNSNYERLTNLPYDNNISRNMRGYYAFSWWRFEHAVHPMTTSAIIETGFLTSPLDRELLIGNPQLSAKAISLGILEHLKIRSLIS